VLGSVEKSGNVKEAKMVMIALRKSVPFLGLLGGLLSSQRALRFAKQVVLDLESEDLK